MLDLSLSQIPDELHEHAQSCHQKFQKILEERNISADFNNKEYKQLLKNLYCSDFILQTITKQTDWFFNSIEE